MDYLLNVINSSQISNNSYLFPIILLAVVFSVWAIARIPIWVVSLIGIGMLAAYSSYAPIDYKQLSQDPKLLLIIAGLLLLVFSFGVALGKFFGSNESGPKSYSRMFFVMLLCAVATGVYLVKPDVISGDWNSFYEVGAILLALGFAISIYKFVKSGIVLVLFLAVAFLFSSENFLDKLPEHYLADYLKNIDYSGIASNLSNSGGELKKDSKADIVIFSTQEFNGSEAASNDLFPGVLSKFFPEIESGLKNIRLASLKSSYIQKQVENVVKDPNLSLIALPCPADSNFKVTIPIVELDEKERVVDTAKKRNDFKIVRVITNFVSSFSTPAKFRGGGQFEKFLFDLANQGKSIVLYNNPAYPAEVDDKCYQTASNVIGHNKIVFADVRHAFEENADDILYLSKGKLSKRGHHLTAKTVADAIQAANI